MYDSLAIILGNKIIRDTVINFGRAVMFSTAPTFPFVAAVKSGYKVLSTKAKVGAYPPFLSYFPPSNCCNLFVLRAIQRIFLKHVLMSLLVGPRTRPRNGQALL